MDQEKQNNEWDHPIQKFGLYFGMPVLLITAMLSFLYPDFRTEYGIKLIFFLILLPSFLILFYYEFLIPKQEKWREDSERNKLDREAKMLELEKEKNEEKIRMHELYKRLRKDIEAMPKYSNWRQAVFQKFGNVCEVCGSTNALEIHHKKSFHSIIKNYHIIDVITALECDALWDVGNGSVMCKECHKKTSSHVDNINRPY